MRSMRTRSSALLALALVATAGCGGDETNGAGGGGGDDTGGRAAVVVRTERVKSGPLTNSFGSMAATFLPTAAVPACSSTTFGECVLETCSPAGATPKPAPEAGPITLGGGAKTLKLTPATDGTYPAYAGSELLWNGGETLMVSAAGGAAVPAFSISLPAPSKLSVTDPMPNLGVVTGQKGKDLTVRWSGGASTPTVVRVSTTASGKEYTLRCSFTGGSGTVPSAGLSALPGGSLTLAVDARSDAMVTAGKWTVAATALSAGLDAQSHVFSYGLTLQ